MGILKFSIFMVSVLFMVPRPASSSSPDHEKTPEEILAGMSTEQKVGQLMMVGFGGKKMGPEIKALVKGLHVGAVALYSRNIHDIWQVKRLVSDLRKAMRTEIQPFIAIDQEGGNVVRIHSRVSVLPGSMTLGATRDPVLAFLAGQAQGVDLQMVGLNMNLAPVLDTNINPKNPVINVRAFGEKASLVAQMGTAFIHGQQMAGLTTVAKHFPGHGSTTRDSHFSLPRITLSREKLFKTELLPFRKAVEAGLDAIMTAHIEVPAFEKDGTPASLSHEIITELLRKRMGFNGLVITDDLEMRAISAGRGVGPSAVRAILAGADMVMVIWTPSKKKEVFRDLLKAVETNTISQKRLDRSVLRILRLKAKRGVLSSFDSGVNSLTELSHLPNRLHSQITRNIAIRGITLVKNKDSLLPLCGDKRLLVISPYKLFRQEMSRLLPGSTLESISLVSSKARREAELNRLIHKASEHDVIVIGATNVYQAWLVQQLQHKIKIPMVVVSFGSPYLLRYFPRVAAYLCTYSYQASAMVAAARAIAGQHSITGRLPVSLGTRYPSGRGLMLRRRQCK